MRQNSQGFTLVELLTIIVIMGVLAGVVASRSVPQTSMQLLAARDLVVATLFSAQQKAMVQSRAIRFESTTSAIHIRMDANSDDNFEVSESIRYAGTQYPINLPGGVTASAEQIAFNRLGRSGATSITLTKGSDSVTVTVTGAGYAY